MTSHRRVGPKAPPLSGIVERLDVHLAKTVRQRPADRIDSSSRPDPVLDARSPESELAAASNAYWDAEGDPRTFGVSDQIRTALAALRHEGVGPGDEEPLMTLRSSAWIVAGFRALCGPDMTPELSEDLVALGEYALERTGPFLRRQIEALSTNGEEAIAQLATLDRDAALGGPLESLRGVLLQLASKPGPTEGVRDVIRALDLPALDDATRALRTFMSRAGYAEPIQPHVGFLSQLESLIWAARIQTQD